MHEPKRIILCRLGGIGDVMHTLPLVKYLKNCYKQASVEYITSSYIAQLLKVSCSYLDKVWSFNKKEKAKIAKDILSNGVKVDYIFNLHTSSSFFFFNFLYIRAKKLFQYKKDNSVHAVVNFAKTFDPNLSGLYLDSKVLSMDQDSAILTSHGLNANKYICIVPGVGKVRPHRAWSIENWLSLSKKLSYYEKNLKIVFLGGKSELDLIDDFSGFGDRAINLIGKLDLTETAKVILSSAYLISCDTGLLHLASALSKKVIGLYGPTLPQRSGPFTGDYQVFVAKDCKCLGGFFDVKKCKKTSEANGYCMNSLDVNQIVSALSCKILVN